MIRCYCDPPSVLAGATLTVCVSTDADRFALRVFRQTATFERVADVPEYEAEGVRVGEGGVDDDWGWPAYALELPESLPSGVYFVVAGERAPDGKTLWPDCESAAGEWGKALFVILPPDRSRSSVLYKLNWFTFACYNWTGGGSLYQGARWSNRRATEAFRVSWRRPGVGAGGVVAEGDPADVYVPGSRRQTFEHWDAPFFRWLYERRIGFDVASDLDVHRDPGLLGNYNLVLSVGHDEYWSDALRDSVDDYISSGGNVAFLSGNTCCFRVDVDEKTATLSCEKTRGREHEYMWQARRPEQETTGVSYFNAGGWWDGHRAQVGYRPYHRAHWVYEGVDTSLELGASTSPPIVGYECDGADYRMQRGRPVVTGGFFGRLPVVLGIGELGEGWHAAKRGAAATIVTYSDRSGGIVFTGATTDWPIVAEIDPQVGRVTGNVLAALAHPSLRILGPYRDGPVVEVVETGQSYDFRVLAPRGRAHAELRGYAWRIAWDDEIALDWSELGDSIRVDIPADAGVVTVSVEARTSSGERCGFGSRSFDVLNAAECATVEFVRALRRAATPGGPPGNLTHPELEFPFYRFPLSPTQARIQQSALEQLEAAHARLPDVDR